LLVMTVERIRVAKAVYDEAWAAAMIGEC
jgi:hypothetical protein